MTSEKLVIPSREQVLGGVNVEVLESPGVLVRPAADFVVDLSGGSIEHCLSEAQTNARHGSYRNRFSDVVLFGYHHFHGILTTNNTIYSQEIDGLRERLKTHILHHPGRDEPIPQIYSNRNGFRVRRPPEAPEWLEGTVYFGTPIEPLNWGMWLLQAIPSAVDFLHDGRADRFFAYMERDWQRSLLHAVGIPDDRLVHHELARSYQCDEIVLRQYTQVDLIPTPREKEVFSRLARRIGGGTDSRATRRLFLSRRTITAEADGRYRALLNEAELVEAFLASGYEVVEPELLSFAEQVRLFSEADLVVGLGGAALFNVIFCPPATRVVTIESSAAFVHAHACLFAALDHPFGVIFGNQDTADETPVQKRWTVDVAGVMKALEQYE